MQIAENATVMRDEEIYTSVFIYFLELLIRRNTFMEKREE